MKRKNGNEKPRRGRPERLTEADLAQIEEWSLAGLSTLQMASLLKCSRKAVETFLDSHKDLKARIPSYKENSAALAKLILHQQLEAGDAEAARWYLTYRAKLEMEKARIGLLRAQKAALQPTKEELPNALEPGAYWRRVNDYFTNRQTEQTDQKEQQQSDAESSDKDGTTEAAGDKAQTDKQD
ncbi:MAG: hypothetical protein IKX40_06670 [Thermoguttaceae bacterium]|nr:hypothetical protein [Thermoguttaceae bacterium]